MGASVETTAPATLATVNEIEEGDVFLVLTIIVVLSCDFWVY